MAHWIVGGVVSTTVSELAQLQLGPHDDVAEQETCKPLFAMVSATVIEPSALAVTPVAEHATVGAIAEQASVAVAEKALLRDGLHSTEHGAEHVMVGLAGLIATVSLHEAVLPAWSVAVHEIWRPLQSQLVSTDTVPSAFSVQHADEPAGHEHLTVGVEQQSVAVAEMSTGLSPQLAVAAEQAH